MKTTLKNTTVRSYKNNQGEVSYMIYKGKGTGSQIATASTMEEAKSFDENFHNVEYRIIFENETNARGGAYFIKGTDSMFFAKHPFLAKGFHF